MPVRTYPVASIPDGARACINNSRNLLQSARILLDSGRKDHSFILYTFAVEEFGKALMLAERKNVAQGIGQTQIQQDNVTFHEHDDKLKKAEAVNVHLGVQLIDESTIPEIDAKDFIDPSKHIELKFGGKDDFQYNGKFLDFNNRLNLLYVDYDEQNNKWRDFPSLPFNMELGFAFEALREELDKFAI